MAYTLEQIQPDLAAKYKDGLENSYYLEATLVGELVSGLYTDTIDLPLKDRFNRPPLVLGFIAVEEDEWRLLPYVRLTYSDDMLLEVADLLGTSSGFRADGWVRMLQYRDKIRLVAYDVAGFSYDIVLFILRDAAGQRIDRYSV